MSVRPILGRIRRRSFLLLAAFALSIATTGLAFALGAGIANPHAARARREQGQPDAQVASGTAALEGHARSVSAQGSSPPMTVHVGSALVEWHAPDGSSVAGSVLRDGVVVAEGRGYSHQGGWLSVSLAGKEAGQPPAAGGAFAIVAGDVVRLEVISGTQHAEAVVPPLSAQVENESGRLRGESEPGRTLRVELAREDERFLRTMHAALFSDAFEDLVPPEPRPEDRWSVQAGPDGRWALDPGAISPLPGPGDFLWVSALDDRGHRFVLDWAVPAQTLRDDGLLLSVGPPGSVQTVAVVGTDEGSMADVALRHGAMAFHWGIRRRYFSVAYGFLELPRPIEAGDRISITTHAAAGIEGSAASEEIVLPPLDIDVQPDGSLGGVAPPEAELWLALRGPDTQSLTQTLRADTEGRWQSAAPVHVGAGWQVTAAAPVGAGGLRFLRTRTDPLIRIMSGTPFLVIHSDLRAAPPFQSVSERITVTLRGPDGTVRGRGLGSNFDGYGRLEPKTIAIEPPDAEGFDNQPPFIAIRPEDRLEVELIAGDPQVLRVPRFEAQIDEARSALSLRAPPLAQVSLALLGSWRWEPRGHEPVNALTLDTDAAGLASMDLAALVPTAPSFTEPHWGIASLTLPGGFEVATGFARASVTVDLDSGQLQGFGPPWQSAEVELFDAEGRLRGSDGQAGRIFNRTDLFQEHVGSQDSTSWRAQLVDAAGQRLRPTRGDELVVRFGAEPWRVTVPLLEAVLFAEEDRVEGRGPALGEVHVQGRSGDIRWERRLPTDAQGRFGLDLGAEGIDLRFGDGVGLRTRAGRITLTGRAISPGLTLDLDRGSLRANVGAMRAVTVRLRSDGRLLASTLHHARPDGSYRALFDAVQLGPGREIALETRSHGGLPIAASLRVPELRLEPDVERGEVRIHAPAGMQLWPSISPSPGAYDARTRTVPPNGIVVLRGEEDAALDLQPGSVILVTLRTEEGHSVLRQSAIPEIRIPVGGARVCGWAEPGVEVGLRAYRGGDALAHGEAIADALGRFSFLLRDDLGAVRFLKDGDRVLVDRDGTTRELNVQPLRGVVDIDSASIFEGSAAPGSRGVLTHMDRPECRQWRGRPNGQAWTADEEGAIVGDDRGSLAIRGIDLSFPAVLVHAYGWPAIFDLSLAREDGFRQYRLLRALRVEVHADTPEVRGEAPAGEVVSLSLRDDAGQARSSTLAVADSDGLWTARWRDEAGQDVQPHPGDHVLVASGASTAEIEVRTFGFDRIGERLSGAAPPGSTIQLRYTLNPLLFGGTAIGDEPHMTTVFVETDDSGRFEIPLASEGQGWTERDLVSVRAAVQLEGRHELVAEWIRPPDLGETPARAYVPWAAARR